MKFGLKDANWSVVTQLAIHPLRKLGAKVYVFGSRARGDSKELSDLDLLYETDEPIALSQIAQIKFDLEESDLPIKVDIVDVRDLPSSFLSDVMKERVAV